MAVVDADYKFMYVDVGAEGAGSDGGVFQRTELRQCMEEGSLGLPPPCPLPGGTRDVGYFFVGDEAFPLRPWLMKPIPRRSLTTEQRIYNYRISRARRVVENAFGILSSRYVQISFQFPKIIKLVFFLPSRNYISSFILFRFRCLLSTMQQRPERVQAIVMACCLLHNLMRKRKPTILRAVLDHEDPNTRQVVQGQWRQDGVLTNIQGNPRGTHAHEARDLREYLVEWVNGPGKVCWQQDKI
jgi:hypothetical protein